jgi:glutamate/tyrosine decarboxylase-like PLP-dependent enzyme
MTAMTARAKQFDAALTAAHRAAQGWLSAVPTRQVPPRQDIDQVAANIPADLADEGAEPSDVVAELDRIVEPGLMTIASGRFFGWVMGATLPAALAADWLVSAWDQNAGLRAATPGVVAAEEAAGRWLLDLLQLPRDSAVGFVTGATTANFSCLAAARQHVLADAGWDVSANGLCGAPRVRVLVGEQRHDSVDAALRYLGLGAAAVVPADEQGRIDVRALEAALTDEPTIVCLQAGNLHSGAFDDFSAAVPTAQRRGAWVHIDGAFGLWAAASPALAPLMGGAADADSWATDAHKTLNVPYDCGVAVVRDSAAMRAALGITGAYLISDAAGDPLDRVPEMSRRARGVPVWAALRSLGRTGVAELVDRLAGAAAEIGAGLAKIDDVEVLNEVGYTQVCFAVGAAERTDAVIAFLRRDGVTWMSGSRWAGRRVIRVSVSNWSIDAEDIAASVDAVARAVAATA